MTEYSILPLENETTPDHGNDYGAFVEFEDGLEAEAKKEMLRNHQLVSKELKARGLKPLNKVRWITKLNVVVKRDTGIETLNTLGWKQTWL